MVRDEPSRERRPERSDAEDAQERETEGEAAKGPRHFSRDEDVLKGLEREQEESEKQRRSRERASRREDRQAVQDRCGGDRTPEQDSPGLAAGREATGHAPSQGPGGQGQHE